jgi:hypothetical protein
MPNWCGNTLTLTHENPEMIARAKAAFVAGKFLNEFIPVPQALSDTTSPNRDEKSAEELIQQHGYSDWYNFCVNEWGTKWDVGDDSGVQTFDDHELIVYFDSAWSPPIAAYEKLMDLGFTVYATYYEPGCAFAGVFEDGTDDYYDLSGMDSGDVQQQLPQELDEAFGISESMAEYEAEQEDDVTVWYKDGVEECGLEPHEVKKNA